MRLTVLPFHVLDWFIKFTSEVFVFSIFCVGSEIYQETLVKALAKYFGARLLIVDSLILPGVSYFKSILASPCK